MNESFDILYSEFENILDEVNNIETFLNSYDKLKQFKEFDNEMQNKFVGMLKILQFSLINDFEKLQNDFISEYKDAICIN